METDRDAMNEAFTTGEDRIAVLLDGAAPRPAPAPPVAAGYTAPAPGSAASGSPANVDGPGFWAGLWDSVKDAAPGVGKALLAEATRAAPEAVSRPVAASAAVAVAEPPQAPKWLPWAILGGALALLAILLKD